MTPQTGQGIATPGVYRIQQLQQSAQFLYSEAKTIAEIEITDQVKQMALPTKLPIPTRHYPLIKPSEISKKRTVVPSAKF